MTGTPGALPRPQNPVASRYARLLAVSPASWLSRDLDSAGILPVRGTLGLDDPGLDGATALWCSGAWAMRLLASGTSHPFLAAGPNWLASVPAQFLGRRIWCGTAAELPGTFPGPVFAKLSEHKHSGVPAALYPGVADFAGQLHRVLGADPEQVSVSVSEPVRYHREYRCFIADGKVAAASFYLSTVPGAAGTDVHLTWDAFDRRTCPDPSAAAEFAQRVCDAMGGNQPPGYTLDVGMDADGRFSVIEANAAWSSNIYHANPAGVIASVLASQDRTATRWAWTPDRHFLNRSRPLPGAPSGRPPL